MADNLLVKGTIAFQAEARLLQELGLRLVASPEVALVELVKNAYDADSPSCVVTLEDDGRALTIADLGHGISLEDFKNKWMRISTSSKLNLTHSPKYRRPLTGAKGIGRFAVRYLGDHLHLESTALDKERGCVTRLTADFNWPAMDAFENLSQTAVAYRLVRVPDDTPTGTRLRISKLRTGSAFIGTRRLRDEVLRMVSPLKGLDRGKFADRGTKAGQDPGFSVQLPESGVEKDTYEVVDIARLVLDNYWARLTIALEGDSLEFKVYLSSGAKPKRLSISVPNSISQGFFADIRFFPRRKGVFQAKGINGMRAWTWVRDNCGVAVVDHGFRMKPFGYADDDWLSLDTDRVHNEREWRTTIAREHFGLSAAAQMSPAENPVLYIPNNLQLVGAVFIESSRKLSSNETIDLIPSMDREGLLDNEASRQLKEFVRAGIEFLAHEDKAELDRQINIEAEMAAHSARDEIKSAIAYIEDSPTLVTADKARIVKQYMQLAELVDEQEHLSDEARRTMQNIGLLGVIAGFMTHESKAAVHELERALEAVRALATKDPQLVSVAADLAVRLHNFQGYVEYARLFVRNVRTPKAQPLSSAGQVRHILVHFKNFAEERGIRVTCDVADGVMTPPMPVTVYSGVLLNLYTNALKAVIATKSNKNEPHVVFRAWNDNKRHFVEVSDNGIGIPPNLQKRIWDPLYTTTSDLGNPLGSGMGLGLTLVKQVVAAFDGKISLVPNPPPGFSTCFRVEFPFAK